MLEIRAAVAKINGYMTDESGDTLEKIERPNGGFSFVLIDGQGTGRGAKSLSNLLAARSISLLKDGARDEAVAMAVHDYLYMYRMGQVAATLNILSVDFTSRQIVMVRNNPAPFFVLTPKGMQIYNEESQPIGLYAVTRPQTVTIPIEPFTYIVMFTDGLLHAGERYHTDLDLTNYLAGWPTTDGRDPEVLTESLLARALELDNGQPSDDMSIVTLAVLPLLMLENEHPFYPARRLIMRAPFE
ncbi:MAG: SpoIIE family protein phosphatase [Chloroflexaceae bacterium]|nr:SpoIIE family protein phosphatase [Chloroflexaceae bacterium]